jgi:2-polyprenyl-3-methyl-5-hydroxy-6-metoxy-1,4-benzoquinol methylase
MSIERFADTQIIDSWCKNAQPWTTAVRNGEIESRKLITDRAIVDAILEGAPRSVLDIGCGEGWLARELESMDIDVIGVDVVPELIGAAQRAGSGDYRAMSYEDIAAGKLNVLVDTIVCNFSLLGKESVAGIFGSIPTLLHPQGLFIVQTLHPLIACGDRPYRDGWREGSWAGFSSDFTNPAPWYFRTLESWVKLFTANGLRLCVMREPLHPKTQQPASILFIAASAE